MKPETTVKKSVLKPVFFSILILTSGIVIGTGITLIVVPPQKPYNLPLPPENVSRQMVHRMVGELRLTPVQAELLNPIITKHMSAIDAIREEARTPIRQELEAMNDEILAMLNTTQQQFWLDRMRQMQEGFPRIRTRRGPGDQRGGGEQRFGPWPNDPNGLWLGQRPVDIGDSWFGQRPIDTNSLWFGQRSNDLNPQWFGFGQRSDNPYQQPFGFGQRSDNPYQQSFGFGPRPDDPNRPSFGPRPDDRGRNRGDDIRRQRGRMPDEGPFPPPGN